MTWEKGQSGNPKGRPVGSIDKSIRQLLRSQTEQDRLALIRKMYEQALGGDVRAAEWIAKNEDAEGLRLEVSTQRFTIDLDRPNVELLEESKEFHGEDGL